MMYDDRRLSDIIWSPSRVVHIRPGGRGMGAYLPNITDASNKRPTINWLKRRGCCITCCAAAVFQRRE